MATEKKGTITVRLKRSLIGVKPDQRATVKGLGLRRRESMSTLENTAPVRGMIKKVIHLLDIVNETR